MAEESSSPKSAPPKEEPRYSLEEAAERGRSFAGVPPYVVIGALAEEERQTHTASQVKAAVDKFLKRDGTPSDAEGDEA